MQEYFEEFASDFGVGDGGTEAEKLGHHREMHGGAHNRADHRAGRTWPDRTLTLSARHILAQQFEDGERGLAMLLEACVVAFERGKQERALHPRVGAVLGDGALDEGAAEA